jgi:2-oxoglutarate ferredoxin oxidoreductase subunit alpha
MTQPMERKLVKGNEAVAVCASKAGCRYYFGYPFTPQNEIPEYTAAHLYEVGGEFVQAESEVASVAEVPRLESAKEVGNERLADMVIPGAYVQKTGIIKIETVESIMPEAFSAHYHKLIPNNIEALNAGSRHVRE